MNGHTSTAYSCQRVHEGAWSSESPCVSLIIPCESFCIDTRNQESVSGPQEQELPKTAKGMGLAMSLHEAVETSEGSKRLCLCWVHRNSLCILAKTDLQSRVWTGVETNKL